MINFKSYLRGGKVKLSLNYKIVSDLKDNYYKNKESIEENIKQ